MPTDFAVDAYTGEKSIALIKAAVEKCIGEETKVRIESKCNLNGASYYVSTIKSYNKLPNLPTHPDNFYVCGFSLDVLPSCCGYAVSSGTYIEPRFRNRGLATDLQGVKEQIAKNLGFSFLLATCIKNNSAEIRVLEKTGWKRLHEGKNGRTGNDLILWVKEI